MTLTKLERNYFWTTLWAQDDFPKNIQEYKQFIKIQIN